MLSKRTHSAAKIYLNVFRNDGRKSNPRRIVLQSNCSDAEWKTAVQRIANEFGVSDVASFHCVDGSKVMGINELAPFESELVLVPDGEIFVNHERNLRNVTSEAAAVPEAHTFSSLVSEPKFCLDLSLIRKEMIRRSSITRGLMQLSLFLLFLALHLTILALQHKPQESFVMETAFYEAVVENTPSFPDNQFQSLTSYDDLFSWLTPTMLDLFFPEQYANGKVSFVPPSTGHTHHYFNDHNLVLGIHVHQVKRRRIVCPPTELLHPGTRSCYEGTFDRAALNQYNGTCCSPQSLRQLFDAYPRQVFNDTYCSDSTKNSTADEVADDLSGLCTAEGVEILRLYSRGLFFSSPWQAVQGFNLFLHSGRYKSSAQKELSLLKTFGWIDDSTKEVTLRIAVYNPGMYRIGIFTVKFHFSITGRLTTAVQTFSVSSANSLSNTDKFRIVCEASLTLFLLVLIIHQVRLVRQKGTSYFRSAWNLLTVTYIVLMICSVILWTMHVVYVIRFQDVVHVAHQQFNDTSQEATSYQEALKNIFLCAGTLQQLFMVYRFTITGILTVLMVASLLLFNFHSKLCLFPATILNALGALAHFLPTFFVIYFLFACIGYLMFGHRSEEYSTILLTVVELFRCLLGVSDFQDVKEAEGGNLAAEVFVVLYNMAFYLCIILLIMSMFVAIITDAYSVSAKPWMDEPSFYADLSRIFHDFIDRLIVLLQPTRVLITTKTVQQLLDSPELHDKDQVELHEVVKVLHNVMKIPSAEAIGAMHCSAEGKCYVSVSSRGVDLQETGSFAAPPSLAPDNGGYLEGEDEEVDLKLLEALRSFLKRWGRSLAMNEMVNQYNSGCASLQGRGTAALVKRRRNRCQHDPVQHAILRLARMCKLRSMRARQSKAGKPSRALSASPELSDDPSKVPSADFALGSLPSSPAIMLGLEDGGSQSDNSACIDQSGASLPANEKASTQLSPQPTSSQTRDVGSPQPMGGDPEAVLYSSVAETAQISSSDDPHPPDQGRSRSRPKGGTRVVILDEFTEYSSAQSSTHLGEDFNPPPTGKSYRSEFVL